MNFLYGTHMQYRSSIWFLYVFLMVGIQYIHIYILFYMVTMQSFEKNQLQHLYRFFIRYPYCNIENRSSSYMTTILIQKIYMDDINIFFQIFIQYPYVYIENPCGPYMYSIFLATWVYIYIYTFICICVYMRVCKQIYIYICVTSEIFLLPPPLGESWLRP